MEVIDVYSDDIRAKFYFVKYMLARKNELNLTDDDICKYANISQEDLNSIEDITCVPGWNVMKKYLDVLGITIIS